mmetsp:Transcript_17615/g.27673  ORF Transcript_17615/g.27673 Transcript_17615/m.27673 type:complete len:205 (+) Transcript_17615:2396-3010(+)
MVRRQLFVALANSLAVVGHATIATKVLRPCRQLIEAQNDEVVVVECGSSSVRAGVGVEDRRSTSACMRLFLLDFSHQRAILVIVVVVIAMLHRDVLKHNIIAIDKKNTYSFFTNLDLLNIVDKHIFRHIFLVSFLFVEPSLLITFKLIQLFLVILEHFFIVVDCQFQSTSHVCDLLIFMLQCARKLFLRRRLVILERIAFRMFS